MASFKKNQEVRFRTRQDRPTMKGKVAEVYNTVKGQFVRIIGSDGVTRRVRPCYIG